MATKQKIAFLCHPYHRGGVTRWMADAAIAFSEWGNEVYFVTVEPVKPFHASADRETLIQLLTQAPNVVTLLTAKVGREFEYGTTEYRAFIYQKLLVQVPAGTPVILSDAPAVWKAATSLQEYYPIIGVLHADEDYYYNHAENYFRKVDILVCVSNRISDNTKKRLPGFDPARVFTIPCGINLPQRATGINKGDRLQLVYVGRVSNYQKRTADLLKITSLLAEKNVNFRLSIIGDGDARVPLEQRFRESGLDEYVIFTGWLTKDEVALYLSESDILVLTSDFEGTPIAMMEALAAGCGVVATRVSGIEDYEFHPLAAECLSVFAVGDLEDAAEKITSMAARPIHMRQDAARKLAETEFSLRVCLDKYLKVIATVIPRSSNPPTVRLSPLKSIYSGTLAMARSMKMRLARE